MMFDSNPIQTVDVLESLRNFEEVVVAGPTLPPPFGRDRFAKNCENEMKYETNTMILITVSNPIFGVFSGYYLLPVQESRPNSTWQRDWSLPPVPCLTATCQFQIATLAKMRLSHRPIAARQLSRSLV